MAESKELRDRIDAQVVQTRIDNAVYDLREAAGKLADCLEYSTAQIVVAGCGAVYTIEECGCMHQIAGAPK